MALSEILKNTNLTRVPPYWDSRYTKNLDKLSKPIYEVEKHLDVWMTLSDGTRLCTDVYRSKGLDKCPAARVFGPGHKIQLEIKAMDPSKYQEHTWTGKVGCMGPVPSAKTTNYKIYRDCKYQSYLLMPYIPETPEELWLKPLDK